MTDAELKLLDHARRMCVEALGDKGRVGRNEVAGVLETFPHELQDISFILYDKTTRILGAEKCLKALPVTLDNLDLDRELNADILDNLVDIVNYSLFGIMMMIAREGVDTDD